MKPIHRDDVPMEVMQDLEKFVQDQFPGMKVVCAGDQPGEIPPEILEQLEAIEQQMRASMINGTCLDCGLQMEDYRPEVDDWLPNDNWKYFRNTADGTPSGWQCPECDAKDQEEGPRFIRLGEEDGQEEGEGDDSEGWKEA